MSTSAGLTPAASSAAPLSALSSPLTAARAGVFMAAEAAAEERVIKRLERRRIMGEERYKRGGAPFDKEIHKDVVGKMSDKFKSEVIEQMKESPFRELVRGEGAKQVTFQLAQEYGFCWGVERSIELAWAARDAYPENTMHITNELIHNPGVNDMLHDMDVQFIEKDTTTGGKRFEDVGDGDVVILPAFGASLEEMQLLDEKGVTVVDTTCPWVSKVWTVVDKHQKADMTSVIHGKYAHEEAIATASMCEEYIIVKNIDEAGSSPPTSSTSPAPSRASRSSRSSSTASRPGFDPAKHLKKIGIANQTTMYKKETQAIGKLFEKVMMKK